MNDLPTAEDLARDLVADLAWVETGPKWPAVAELRRVALAALRRAIAAERDLADRPAVGESLALRVAKQSELLTRRGLGPPRWEDQPKADSDIDSLVAEMDRRLPSPPACPSPSATAGLGAWLAARPWLPPACVVIEDDGEVD